MTSFEGYLKTLVSCAWSGSELEVCISGQRSTAQKVIETDVFRTNFALILPFLRIIQHSKHDKLNSFNNLKYVSADVSLNLEPWVFLCVSSMILSLKNVFL